MPELNDKRLARPEGTSMQVQVTAPFAPLREAPESNGLQVTQALKGEMVNVFDQDGAFLLVQLPRDRYVGWIYREHVSTHMHTPTHKVSALRTIAFAAPDLKSAPLSTLSHGALVSVTGRKEGVWTECAHTGWIHERHLAEPGIYEGDPAGVAERFLGTPYLWGGRQSLGLDCSGLTQQAFEACGAILPRDSDMQAAWAGEEVKGWQAPGALKRGDLMFWEGHVGMLTRPDELLHANAFHLAVEREPLTGAIARMRHIVGDVTTVRRVAVTKARGVVPGWLAAD